MPNLKRYVIGHLDTGPAPQIVIQRDADSFFWEDGVGFVANGGSPVYTDMVEKFSDFWVYETDFEVWENGLYNILIVNSVPEPLAGYSETISGDRQIGFIEASSITAKNAVASVKQALEPIILDLTGIKKALGVLSDRVDAMNQTLARRDYNRGSSE